MIVAGIGCRSGISTDAVLEAVALAMRQCGVERPQLCALATSASKAAEDGLAGAASKLGLPLLFISSTAMQLAASGAITVSARALELKGVPSVAEAVALSAAGRRARLLAPRIVTASVTCAIAEGDGP
jgi:cobalt-precorrin 5A hydrolase